ncbi:MAG: hypothetical protein ACPGUV_08700 [Polyangiales bacterium]
MRACGDWYFALAPALRLAWVRLLVGAYALIYLIARLPHLWSYGAMQSSLFAPVGIVHLLHAPLPSWLYRALVLLTLLGALLFALGVCHRYLAPLFALLLLVVLSYSNSWQKILHTDNLLVLHVGVLALSPAASAGRVAASGSTVSPRFGWPLRLLTLITVSAYLLAGVAKCRHSGWEFVSGDTLRNYIAFANMRKVALGSTHSPLGVALLDAPGFFAVMAWLSLVLELGAPLALVGRRAAGLWILGVWLFHLGVLLLMAIAFLYPLTIIAFVAFFRVERAAARVRRWCRAKCAGICFA